MTTRNTINDKGLVTESTSGNTIEFIVDGRCINKTVTAAVDADVTADNKPVIVVEPNGGDVTVTLPTIGSEQVGLKYVCINADQTNDMILSGTNNFVGGNWTQTVASSSQAAAVMAITASAGMQWARLY